MAEFYGHGERKEKERGAYAGARDHKAPDVLVMERHKSQNLADRLC